MIWVGTLSLRPSATMAGMKTPPANLSTPPSRLPSQVATFVMCQSAIARVAIELLKKSTWSTPLSSTLTVLQSGCIAALTLLVHDICLVMFLCLEKVVTCWPSGFRIICTVVMTVTKL